ncbi:MAG TPA: c-type cytochrome [Anaerolineales bacterium]|nr:c-type cytochrome [Anaerolineales bacterium]
MNLLRPIYPALIILLTLLSACNFSLAEDVTPPPGYQAPAAAQTNPTAVPVESQPASASPDPAAGAAIYAESCLPCHGETGLGDGFQADRLPNPASPIGDPALARQTVPIDWYGVITNGRMDRFMPPFSGSLSDQQRWDALAYAYSLSVSPEQLAQGASLYEESCAGCHGVEGRGDGPEAASLATAPPDFSSPEFFASRSSESLFQVISDGAGQAMPAYAPDFSEEQRWALADYVRSLAFASPLEEVALDLEGTPAAEEGSSGSAPTETALESVSAEPGLKVGQVTGMLVHGSGDEIPDGLQVTLHGFDHIQEVFTANADVEADGSYTFENIEMPESRVFMVTTEYSQATYNSDIAIVEPDTHAINLPVTIYDTTEDSSMLAVDRLHIFLETLEPGSLHVVELYLISNPTDKVIVAPGEGEPVVQYKLPAGATGLQFQSGTPEGRFIITEDGFGDTMAIPPGSGQYQVMAAYDLPYSKKVNLSHMLTLPVNSVVLLVPDVGIKVKGSQLEDNGVRQFQGESYRIYSSDRYGAGSQLEFSVSGSVAGPGGEMGSPDQQSGLMAGGLLFGLSLAIVGGWAFRRFYWIPKREGTQAKRSLPANTADQQGGLGFTSVESVLDAIIALDDLHGAGKLSEAAYHNRRKELFVVLETMKKDPGPAAG